MNELLIELLRYVSIYVCHAVALCLMTDCRYSRRVCRLVWVATGTVCALLVMASYLLPPESMGGVPLLLVSFFTMVACGVVYAVLSRPPWQRALFLFATYANVFLWVIGVSYSLFLQFFADNPFAFVLLRNLIFLVFILLLWWVFRPAFLRVTEGVTEGWGTMAALSALTCVALFLVISGILLLDYPPMHWLTILTLLLVLVGAEYAAILRMIGLLSGQQALRGAESQRKLLESQLAAEEEFVTQARAYRHDARHHAALLADYLEREDTAGAREYLAQYMTQLDGDALEHYCENPVADALLRLTARRCRESGVPFTIQAVIPERLSLSGPELAAVLGNVLENAWEAAGACQAPRLSVTARQKGGSLLVEVENTVDHPSLFEDDLPLTTKPGGGQGLKTVRRTLEKYGGMLRCSRQGSVFATQMTIPL